MGYLDKIAACNVHDLSRSLPFRIDGAIVGWIRKSTLPLLAPHDDVFCLVADGVDLHPRLTTPASRSAALELVLRGLHGAGHIPLWKDEPYGVREDFGAPPLMTMERAAVSLFGIRAYGLHLNGYVRKDNGLYLWIATRALDRAVEPGKRDNMIAGGQPAGLSLRENLIKEAAEEAGVSSDLANQAVPVGLVSYAMDLPRGLRRDVLFVYDLALAPDFVPRNTDGEVGSFELMAVAEVARLVHDTMDFKFNCNLVIIDFLIRHGFIAPDDPDYMAIVTGLRR